MAELVCPACHHRPEFHPMATTSRTRACIDCTRNAATWEGACLLTFGAIVDHLQDAGLLPIAAPITQEALIP